MSINKIKYSSFKEQLELDIIPRLKKLIENEREHLNMLLETKASENMIKNSEYHLKHFEQRYDEYVKYAQNL